MLLYNVPGVGLIAPGTAFSLTTTIAGLTDTFKFPANWLENAWPEELAMHGIATQHVPGQPEPTLEDLREQRLAEAWTECVDRLEAATVSTTLGDDDYTFGLDRETRENIGGIINAINAERSGLLPAGTTPNPRPFAPKGQPLMLFSHEALANVGAAVLAGKDMHMTAYFAHKGAIQAATAEQLVAYDVLDGWPDG